MSEYDVLYKVLLVGDSDVGKTSLIVRYVDGTMPRDDSPSTLGVDFMIKIINMGSVIVKLQIWDTAGQERFRTITTSMYRGSHALIFTYDVSDATTLQGVSRWVTEADRYAESCTTRCLVGNKSDLADARAVTVEEAEEVAATFNMHHFETSARTGTARSLLPQSAEAHALVIASKGLDEVFTTVARTLVEKNGVVPQHRPSLSLQGASGKKRACNV